MTRVDLGLGVVDEVGDLALAGVAHLHDAGARLDETAQQCPLGDDRGVEAGVRRGRHQAREVVQVLHPAGALQVAGLGELVGDGDHVGGFAVRVEREDRVEDDLVLRNVEVDAADGLDDVGHGVLREHHAAEGALLGEEIVRGNSFAPSGFTVVDGTCEPDVRDRQLDDLRFAPRRAGIPRPALQSGRSH